ncbi:hypothetical protein CSB45_00715 [candidate division KSB3 bacterium]|uniref:Anaerobic ribonucleoside-triphosphate reductase-activating protein n=1 Tax=candidate division KSB3 bacterium TaxID=2044937 RepID=A0A2G6ED85_9BACT|nr:MAG: hypothetical protein CSB45_00715 [candidate division KSB3 bacterium]PIE31020.1 MAG: hypothetical protein CSA57_01505 [candidate division KSB3 bacterium]
MLELNLHDFLARSTENGPDQRAVIWVQGCSLGCLGCFNPATHDSGIRRQISVDELAEHVLAISDIEGVTISGGEPFLQADALAELARRLHRAGLGILVFSGFTYEQLSQSGNPAWEKLLAECDLLVAGPFIRERACLNALRGSSNQTLHYLSGRYCTRKEELEFPGSSVEILIDEHGRVRVTGFPHKVFGDLD